MNCCLLVHLCELKFRMRPLARGFWVPPSPAQRLQGHRLQALRGMQGACGRTRGCAGCDVHHATTLLQPLPHPLSSGPPARRPGPRAVCRHHQQSTSGALAVLCSVPHHACDVTPASDGVQHHDGWPHALSTAARLVLNIVPMVYGIAVGASSPNYPTAIVLAVSVTYGPRVVCLHNFASILCHDCISEDR